MLPPTLNLFQQPEAFLRQHLLALTQHATYPVFSNPRAPAANTNLWGLRYCFMYFP